MLTPKMSPTREGTTHTFRHRLRSIEPVRTPALFRGVHEMAFLGEVAVAETVPDLVCQHHGIVWLPEENQAIIVDDLGDAHDVWVDVVQWFSVYDDVDCAGHSALDDLVSEISPSVHRVSNC